MAAFKIALVLVFCNSVIYVNAKCSLHYKNDFNSNATQPVFLMNGKYLVPNPSTCAVEIAAGTDIMVGCPGNENYVKVTSTQHVQKKAKLPNLNSLVATCISGGKFNSRLGSFTLKEISCKEQPDVTILKTSTKCGKNNAGAIYKVEYEVQCILYVSYEVCFDTQLLTTYYAKHEVHSHSYLTQECKGQSFQIKCQFRGVAINGLYPKKNQEERFVAIFGRNQNYVDGTNIKKALEKGHLASRGDCTMAALLRATYQYINTAPQWREVNTPRWFGLEYALRQYVKENKVSVTVYTGTHGVLSLPTPGQNGADKAIYLGVDSAKKEVVPVPLYLYKVVDEHGSKFAYVSINWNSFDPVKLNSLRWCNDQCKLAWKSQGSADFCCNYNTFIQKIGYKPL